MNRRIGKHLIPGLFILLLSHPVFSWATEKGELQDIVNASTSAMKTFLERQEVEALLSKASGVIIYPSITKGAFGVGGERGTGILLGRDDTGSWSQPAFVTYTALSFGLQAGIESSAIVMIVMNQETMLSLLGGKLELGTNATIAAGEELAAKGKLLSTDQLADIYYFAKAKGAFIGLNLKGGVNETRDKFNAIYYGMDATARTVIVDRVVKSKGTNELVKLLSP